MSEVTIIHGDAPAVRESLLTPAAKAALLDALRLPDVSGLALPSDPSIQDLAELAADLRDALQRSAQIYGEAIREVVEMCAIANDQIVRTAPADARAVPHETLEIKIERDGARGRDIATLRSVLPNLGIPIRELRKGVFIKSLDVKGIFDPELLQALVEAGAKEHWDCDLRALDKLARDYGGPAAEVIKKATAPVPLAKPIVSITRKTPPMKAVGEVIVQ